MNVVKPSSVGFHCDSECWRFHGGTEGLFAAISRRGDAKRDWFVTAEWAHEAPQAHPLPPMRSVHPIQDYLVNETVQAYLTGVAAPPQAAHESHPVLFRWNGEIFIFQGTHRLAALYEAEADTYTGWFLDLDAL